MEARAETTASQAEKRQLDPILVGLPAAFVACLLLLPVHLERLFGLPAHPLLLHVPVVLIPILAAAAVALVARPDWRLRYGVALALLALVALASTELAAGAGDALREASGTAAFAPPAGGDAAINEHAELGEQLRNIMVVLTAGIVGSVVLDAVARMGAEAPARLRRLVDRARRPRLDTLIRVGLGFVAVLALVWVVRTGHEGAELTWDRGPAATVGGGQALSAISQDPPRLP